MRHWTMKLALAAFLAASTIATAQDKVLVAQSVTLPGDCVFGDSTLAKGSYRVALTEVGNEKWFVVSKTGKEVARDVAIELPAKELPTTGFRGELLKGKEYYRVRVGRGDKTYLVHFLLKGGKA